MLAGNRFALPGKTDDRLLERSPTVCRGRVLVEAVRVPVAAVAACSQHVGEARVGRVDVQEGHLFGALVGEGVHDTGGRREERPRRPTNHVRLVGPDPERDLAAQDVEGVGVRLVDVALGAVLVRRIAKPRQRERLAVDEQPEGLFRRVGHGLALAGA